MISLFLLLIVNSLHYLGMWRSWPARLRFVSGGLGLGERRGMDWGKTQVQIRLFKWGKPAEVHVSSLIQCYRSTDTRPQSQVRQILQHIKVHLQEQFDLLSWIMFKLESINPWLIYLKMALCNFANFRYDTIPVILYFYQVNRKNIPFFFFFFLGHKYKRKVLFVMF